MNLMWSDLAYHRCTIVHQTTGRAVCPRPDTAVRRHHRDARCTRTRTIFLTQEGSVCAFFWGTTAAGRLGNGWRQDRAVDGTTALVRHGRWWPHSGGDGRA